jgi:hypothetical protein
MGTFDSLFSGWILNDRGPDLLIQSDACLWDLLLRLLDTLHMLTHVIYYYIGR